ncbi:MAG: DUF4347 domain-containing protein [Spirulinaceae cyanobacterium]
MLSTPLARPTQSSPSSALGEGMLVVVDPRVDSVDQLVAGIETGAQVLVLDRAEAAIPQITRFLAHHPGFKSLHLIGHGQPGAMQLGAGILDRAELLNYQAAVRSWSAAFESSHFDLLLYGCSVAQGESGQDFLATLHDLTGANIAAAKGAIGQTPSGPNWRLDQQIGQPATPLAVTATAQAQYLGTLATFNVSTTTDLINSIQAALANSEADTINLAAGTTFDLTSAFTGNANVLFPGESTTGPTGLPIITDTFGLTIQSDSAGTRSTIQRSGGNDFRIFAVAEGAILNLTDVIISNGNAVDTTTTFGDDGGGILNVGGTVTITDSEITNNSALDDGGGILNIGIGPTTANPSGVISTMTITGSTISNNRSSFESGSSFNDGGGGIDNDGNLRAGAVGATLTISDSIISGNTATSGSGGGLRAWDGSTLYMYNTQVTGNEASPSNGSGLGVGSENGNVPILTITGSTIDNNFDTGGTQDDSSVTGNITASDIENTGTFTGNTVGTSDALDQVIEGDGGLVVSFVDTSSAAAFVTDEAASVDIGDFGQGTSSAITFTLENTGSNTINLSNLTSADTSLFTVGSLGSTSLASGATTTFTVTPVDTSTIGAITATTISFDTDDTTGAGGISADGTFNFDVTADVLGPTVQVTFDSTTVADEAASVDIGDFGQGSSGSTTFTVTNVGSGDLTLSNLQSADTSKFTVSSFTVSSLAAGASTTFTVTPVDTATLGAIDPTEISFDTNDTSSISSDGVFNFNATADIIDDLSISDGTLGEFSLGDPTTSGGRLELTVSSSSQSQVELLEVTTSGDETALFTILPDDFRPSEFAAEDQFFLFDISSLSAGDTVQFSVDGKAISTNVDTLDTGRFLLEFDLDSDGATDDLSVIVDQVATTLPIGVGTGQTSELELIDLSNESGSLSATFTLYREAQFTNSVGLYKIDDANGTVNGIAPGDANYAQTAIENRVTGIELAVGNQQTGTATGSLDGGALYAPFIVVNSTITNFLSGDGGGEAFFIYTEANSDGFDHVILLGNNTFGFEDLANGGDMDYNDLIFHVEIG